MTLVEYVNKLDNEVETFVVIKERGHEIFNNDDAIDEGWAECFDVVEIVSETKTSVIIRVKYNWND